MQVIYRYDGLPDMRPTEVRGNNHSSFYHYPHSMLGPEDDLGDARRDLFSGIPSLRRKIANISRAEVMVVL